MSKARILIVEDESIAAIFLRKLMEKMGYLVIGVLKTAKKLLKSQSK